VAINDGLHGLFKILLRKGSLLDAGPAHAVAAGTTETAQRIIDVVLGALSQALPQPIRAASAGTCSSLTLRAPLAAASPPTPVASPPAVTASLPAGDAGAPSGPVSAAAFGANRTSAADPATTANAGASAVAASPGAAVTNATAAAASRRLYLHEFLAGGLGASPAVDGATGQHAPAGPRGLSSELLEQRLPVRVLRLEVRTDSGGGGVRTGGSGLRRELLLLEALHVELCGERRRRPPYGLGGGGPGQLGRDTLIRDGAARPLPAKARLVLSAGDILRTESPGGGGYGDPMRAAFFAALLA
jgi:N-methylhydantoinase B/oxoprolinase/acetone carboxylase alpha subunit